MRLFEVLDKLNQMDSESGTTDPAVRSLPDVIAVNMYSKHGDIKIGLPHHVAQKLILQSERYRPILIVIDMDEYNKINPK